MESLVQDVRYGVRQLVRNPGFAIVAILSLALGIGANTAIFSLIHAVLVRPLPVKSPEELVVLTQITGPGAWYSFSYPLYSTLRDQNHVFSGVLASSSDVRLDMVASTPHGHSLEAIVRARGVSGNYFALLGVSPLLGRALTPEDDSQPGSGGPAGPTVVIGYEFWNRTFSRTPSILGARLTLNGTAFTVVGVMPREFFGESVGERPDLWFPLLAQPNIAPGGTKWFDGRTTGWLNVVGRVKPGMTVAEAGSDIDVIFRQYRAADFGGSTDSPGFKRSLERERIDLSSGRRGLDSLRTKFSDSLLILMSIVGLVLVIACANVASLLVARGVARAREIAVRLALGAGRGRLIRQLLTESTLLAAAAGLVGVLMANSAGSLLLTMASREATPAPIDLHVDGAILGFVVSVSLAASLLFGLAPALGASRVDLAPVLKSVSALSGGGSRISPRKLLVVAQVALSVLLLVGASLFVRSLQKLRAFDAGFQREGVTIANIDSRATRRKPTDLVLVYERLLDRLHAIPGVRSASLSYFNLFRLAGDHLSIYAQGRAASERQAADVDYVSTRYFETVGMPLVLGRGFEGRDGAPAPRVAVVNETFARRFWPNESPLGKRFGLGGAEHSGEIEIVGVVTDAKYGDIREDARRRVFLPYLQQPRYLTGLQVRAAGSGEVLSHQIRAVAREVEPGLPVLSLSTLDLELDRSLWQERLIAKLSSFFGGLALLLASIGLYGVLSYAVTTRTREIGIRMALGAERSQVLRSVLREALGLVLAGISLGIPAAIACGRFLAAKLFGLSAADPIAIAFAVGALVMVAAVAAWIPAMRAARVDPMAALRYQ